MTPSYLVSTAGHAQHQNNLHPHDIRSILQLIEDGASEFGQEKVVGFISTSGAEAPWTCDRFSFIELLAYSDHVAGNLREDGVLHNSDEGGIISMLFPTGIDFLVTWIALMRLGYGVIFIAPQCSPSAINHLVRSTGSIHLIYHPKYAELASTAREQDSQTTIIQLSHITTDRQQDPIPSGSNFSSGSLNEVSHIFHTSGTSGTPKPIPQTHLASVSVLPRRALPSYLSALAAAASPSKPTELPSEPAAFTTTPLFHGGVSDLLRAWMARSMIYFYPTSDTPITSQNVVQALKATESPPPALSGTSFSESQLSERAKRFRVASFLSVPYVLTILSEDLDGPAMEMLERMEFVSTGGAPLDTRIGDAMVARGVRLVSRLGSSECGFLLSSHRDYETERDWEWLRNDSAFSDALSFELFKGDGETKEEKFEMVVTDKWTSKTKTNREDGSYATGDLYQRHPTKANVWRYIGRGDDVIVMSNGEKAAPGPIESVLRSSPHLSDALVVGTDRPHLGLLLFRSPASAATPDVLDLVRPLVAQANQSSPSFAQISLDMCLVVDNSGKALPKSSKGTIQRGLAYEVFREETERLYETVSSDQDGNEKRDLPEIESRIKGIIVELMGARRNGDSLGRTTDLFSWGVDSLMATRVRTAIQRNLNTAQQPLSKNVVFEKPSVARLAQHIYDLQENVDPADNGDADPHRLMEDLVEKYGAFTPPTTAGHAEATPAKSAKTFVLTGVTGSLGSFLLEQLSQLPVDIVERIICLVRADDDGAAQKRIMDGQARRGLGIDRQRLEVYAADLTRSELGLTPQVYSRLVDEADVILHAAWPVHFASGLISFEDSIKGTRHLIDLVSAAKSASAKLYYFSSLASVLAQPPSSGGILELPSDDPSTASPIGYSRSKWVTERVCRLACERGGLADRVHILRIGQLCGDTRQGHWNEKEGWPLLIRTAQTTGCLPLLPEKPSWLPVDTAAAAIIELVTGDDSDLRFIYHIAHPRTLDWDSLLDNLQAAGLSFDRVSPSKWLERVEASSEDTEENPSIQMLSMWQAAYGYESIVQPQPEVDTTQAQAACKTLRNALPIDSAQIELMVKAWRRTGFLA